MSFEQLRGLPLPQDMGFDASDIQFVKIISEREYSSVKDMFREIAQLTRKGPGGFRVEIRRSI